MILANLCKCVESNYISQEVRVRFAGFGKEDDEWVNVKRGVRECHKVKVGDLVLCFQVIFLFGIFYFF